MIELSGVSKFYDGNPVVNGVSVTVPRGGLTSIIGPNGAGKSTLLSIIARLLPADEGSVRVDGRSVFDVPTAALARRIAILRQDNNLASRLTVQDVVAFGRYPHSRGRMSPHDHAKIEDALGFLGLLDFRHRYLDELSGGQRQRAFVAMVICQDTDFMLFDEPLNNLDIRHSVSMMSLLRETTRRLGKTVAVVLHDINFAANYSDHIVVMKDGRIFAQGRPASIMSAEMLTSIYETNFRVHEIDGQLIATYY